MTTKPRDYTYTINLCAACGHAADLVCEDCRKPICAGCWSRSAYGLAWELLSKVGPNLFESGRMPVVLCQDCAGWMDLDKD